MGVINITPDSFSDGGLYNTPEAALIRAEEMVEEGVRIIDIGGESTRPGSVGIGVQEELDRVIPVLEKILSSIDILVSCDTSKPLVASEALKYGAVMINDVTGAENLEMIRVVEENNAALCIMHMKGCPETMQKDTLYDNMFEEVRDYLYAQASLCVELGVDRENICLDPGIGFGKSPEDNLRIMGNVGYFKGDYPLLMGVSRKSVIGKYTGVEEANKRLGGSIASAVWLALEGVDIVRAHDTKETCQALRIAALLKESKNE